MFKKSWLVFFLIVILYTFFVPASSEALGRKTRLVLSVLAPAIDKDGIIVDWVMFQKVLNPKDIDKLTLVCDSHSDYASGKVPNKITFIVFRNLTAGEIMVWEQIDAPEPYYFQDVLSTGLKLGKVAVKEFYVYTEKYRGDYGYNFSISLKRLNAEELHSYDKTYDKKVFGLTAGEFSCENMVL